MNLVKNIELKTLRVKMNVCYLSQL